MTMNEPRADTAPTEEIVMKPATPQPAPQSSWKSKRGALLQQTGVALLSGPGTEQEKIECLLEEKN